MKKNDTNLGKKLMERLGIIRMVERKKNTFQVMAIYQPKIKETLPTENYNRNILSVTVISNI